MKITKIHPIGYCKGVTKAINTLFDTIKKYPNEPIYCLGQIVHNDYVNQQFEKYGVQVITSDKTQAIKDIDHGIVIFSAHGSLKGLQEKAIAKKLHVIDTTCSYVFKSMENIQSYVDKDYDIIFIGKAKHPEAEAICSLSHRIHLIESLEQAKQLNVDNQKILLTNQTTLSITDLKDFFAYFKQRYPNIVISDEICSATRLRQEALLHLDSSIDGIIVIGDHHSNNCTQLYLLAKKLYSDVIFISNKTQLDFNWAKNKTHIALISGTSTPIELINEIESEFQKTIF